MAVVLCEIGTAALDVAAVLAAVSSPHAGGIALFVGTVRDHDHALAVAELEYTAHPSAREELQRVCDDIAARSWPDLDGHDLRLAAIHRVGPLQIGDLAVVVAAAAPHREQAFAACRMLIDELKEKVPIWKSQRFADGSQEWVGVSVTASNPPDVPPPFDPPVGPPVLGIPAPTALITPVAPPSRRPTRAAFVLGLLLAMLLIAGSIIHLPYAVLSPGPAYNVLGSMKDAEGKDTDLIAVSVLPNYRNTAGTLDFTTVRVAGGPGHPVSVFDVLGAWVSPTSDVYPVEEFFPPQQTEEQVKSTNAAMMVSSQQYAAGVALDAAGVSKKVMIAEIAAGVPAATTLQVGDTLTSIGGTPVTSTKSAVAAIRAQPGGQPVRIVVDRGGKVLTLDVGTRRLANGQAQLGVALLPAEAKDIHIAVGDIGGPSAGLMFALGIYELVTPGDLTGSARIAGTGTLAPSGQVGPIGGIKQKMAGAAGIGATFFLAPADNCGEVVGNVPSGMEAFKVATFDEALADVKAIAAGRTADLPRCS